MSTLLKKLCNPLYSHSRLLSAPFKPSILQAPLHKHTSETSLKHFTSNPQNLIPSRSISSLTRVYAIQDKHTCTTPLKHCTSNPLNLIPSRSISSPTKVYAIQENISSLHLKKRPARKKKPLEDEDKPPGVFSILAYSTAEEYNLEALIKGLQKEDLYEPRVLENNDVVHAVAKYQVGTEPREVFFFREGSCVMWNMTDLESCNLLSFLKPFEQDQYSEVIVHSEAESMDYSYQPEGKPSALSHSGDILIASTDNTLDKYTFSNAIGLSVKLGIWEASLEKYIDSIEFVTGDLKKGNTIKMTQEEALRKHGELFALRHVINLSSDLLDVPDFYWDREKLEVLYTTMCGYFSIARRTRVMNEKINHCVELIELLSSHLSDKHHIRLEWMIIILIMVEVGFEIIHYIDRYFV